MAFLFRKSIDGSSSPPVNLYAIAKDSIAFQVGDLIRINTSGFADVVDQGECIGGVCVGVVDINGLPVTPDSGTTDTWTMGSTNSSATYKKVVFIPAFPQYLFYNDADGTLTQAMEFEYFDTNDENDVDIARATDTWSAQVQLISRDPDGDADASKGLFRIVESQFGQVGVTRSV